MSAYAPAPNAYRESAVLTATPEQLVVMLYDGANRFLTQSSIAMRDGRAGLAGEKLRRAEAIIDELLATLDMSVGEIAERLQALYLFFKEHLMSARLKQDAGKVDEVAALHARAARPRGPPSPARERPPTSASPSSPRASATSRSRGTSTSVLAVQGERDRADRRPAGHGARRGPAVPAPRGRGAGGDDGRPGRPCGPSARRPCASSTGAARWRRICRRRRGRRGWRAGAEARCLSPDWSEGVANSWCLGKLWRQPFGHGDREAFTGISR